jgi:hypothetical protein
LVVSSVLSVLLAAAINLASDLLPPSLARNRAVVLLAVGLLWLATVAVALAERRRSPGGVAGPEHPRPARPIRNTLFQVGGRTYGVQVNVHGPEQRPPLGPTPPRDP